MTTGEDEEEDEALHPLLLRAARGRIDRSIREIQIEKRPRPTRAVSRSSARSARLAE
jgi:hypothetical protein